MVNLKSLMKKRWSNTFKSATDRIPRPSVEIKTSNKQTKENFSFAQLLQLGNLTLKLHNKATTYFDKKGRNRAAIKHIAYL